MTTREEWAKFEDRQQGGSLLVGALGKYARCAGAAVFAIPCGGTTVGAQVAVGLDLPLYPLVVQRICLPLHEPWDQVRSIGAVVSGARPVVDLARVAAWGLRSKDVEQATQLAETVGAQRTLFYGGVWPDEVIHGRSLLLVDEAIETGSTMRAAIQALRREQPKEIIIAAPIGSARACRQLAPLADHVICPVQCGEDLRPHDFYRRRERLSDPDAFRIYRGVMQSRNPIAS